ncbi:hypothetical protein M9Y10_007351 [Tritrichomonas musculus]|uniref:Uncharacterized protein n=1 Tax=Tritrichomonas musculus TaxID=1915356 RepID=A0ABR2J236_9EUKA
MDDLEKLVNEIFDKPTFKDEDTDIIFKTPEIINESVQLKPYENFIPTITFYFEKSLQDIDYNELHTLLGDNAILLNVGSFPTAIQIGLLSIEYFEPKTVEIQLEAYIRNIKERISPIVDQSVGKLIEEPKIHIPNKNEIRSVLHRPSLNYNQNPDDLNSNEIYRLQKLVLQKLRINKNHYNLRLLFTHKDLYDEIEEQFRLKFATNPNEFVIVNRTIFPSKFIAEYERIKEHIQGKDTFEYFFYQGSQLINHQRILANDDFDDIEQNDEVFYGKGVYGSEVPFPTPLYVDTSKYKNNDGKTQVICCRTFYNDGLLPDGTLEKERNETKASEFVFPNKFQFVIPFCSLTVMQRDH